MTISFYTPLKGYSNSLFGAMLAKIVRAGFFNVTSLKIYRSEDLSYYWPPCPPPSSPRCLKTINSSKSEGNGQRSLGLGFRLQ